MRRNVKHLAQPEQDTAVLSLHRTATARNRRASDAILTLAKPWSPAHVQNVALEQDMNEVIHSDADA